MCAVANAEPQAIALHQPRVCVATKNAHHSRAAHIQHLQHRLLEHMAVEGQTRQGYTARANKERERGGGWRGGEERKKRRVCEREKVREGERVESKGAMEGKRGTWDAERTTTAGCGSPLLNVASRGCP